MTAVSIQASCGDGSTLEALQNVIKQRMQYLNENAEQSVAACAIDVLRSLRAQTSVAKASKEQIIVSPDHSLIASYRKAGGKAIPCLRTAGGKQQYVKSESEIIRFTEPSKACKIKSVYRWKPMYGKKQFIIVATSQRDAMAMAKSILNSIVKRYSGLAKLALGMLMYKTNTIKPPSDVSDARIQQKANQTTSKTSHKDSVGGEHGVYTLCLEDSLRYAQNALKNGPSTVDMCMQNAMNKIVSVINHKLKGDIFDSKVKLAIPFPK